MPINHHWLLNDHILHAEYIGEVTAKELKHSAELFRAKLDTTDTLLIHLIVDVSALETYPNNLPIIVQSVGEAIGHEKLGWLVPVGMDNQIVEFLVTMVSKVFRTRYRSFDTLEEAIAYLQEMDTNLTRHMKTNN